MRKSALAMGFLAIALTGCGGGESSGGSDAQPLPLTTAPTPTPTPTATPSLAADPGGAMLANATLPGELRGVTICSGGQVTRANGQITSFVDTTPDGPLRDDSLRIEITADYEYKTDFNGFGGSMYPSASRIGGRAFEVFIAANGDDELQIAKALTPLVFTTYGLASYDTPCFFAVGRAESGQPQTLQRHYSTGFGDGLVGSGSDHDRLYGTRAVLTQTGGQAYTLTIEFAAVADAFAEPDGQSVRPIGRATAGLTLAGTVFGAAPITAPGGFSGEISGLRSGVNFGGAIFVFDLRNPAGDRLWGVLALDADAI